MNEGTFISAVRHIVEYSMVQCKVQEYKVEYIIKQYSNKLQNIRSSIERNTMMNFKVKQKYFKVLDNVSLEPVRVKHYDLVIMDLRAKKLLIPSVIEFIKKK